MKRLLSLVLIIILTSVISGCSLPDLPLPWQKDKQAEAGRTAAKQTVQSQQKSTGTVPLSQRKIVLVSERPQPIDLVGKITNFLTAWQNSDYQTLLEDKMWQQYIRENYETNIAFKLYWDDLKKQLQESAAQAGITLFSGKPELSRTILGPEALVEATLDNWVQFQFHLNQYGNQWAIKHVDYRKTDFAEKWYQNNSFYKTIKPLYNSYQTLVDWSDWAFQQDTPQELSRYYRDIQALENRLTGLKPTPEARQLQENWLAAVRALRKAVAEKMNQKDPETIIRETSTLVDTIDRAENMKDPLTDKLEKADGIDEDLAEDTLANAQTILEQKLQQLKNKSNLSNTSVDTQKRTWEDLHSQFTSSFDDYQEQYGGTN
ncbi:MAG: hypothetical protein H0Z35_05420 [Thermoanaerobacteraceae bacterium]|nr:hypothetical protein [Thermoanaerobacteraceae bacterium]